MARNAAMWVPRIAAPIAKATTAVAICCCFAAEADLPLPGEANPNAERMAYRKATRPNSVIVLVTTVLTSGTHEVGSVPVVRNPVPPVTTNGIEMRANRAAVTLLVVLLAAEKSEPAIPMPTTPTTILMTSTIASVVNMVFSFV